MSCRSQISIYEFDPRNLKNNKITLSEIADDINYIPLDNSFPINLIYKPKYFINNTIYLSSRESGIMAFDKSGKLIRKIGAIGRGPGEYITNFNFTVDNVSETIYVFDGSNYTINVYSRSGIFLRKISAEEFKVGIDAMESYNSNLFLSYPLQFVGVKYDWITMDSLGRVIKKKERSIPPFIISWGLGGGFYKFENKLNHWSPFTDAIISILPDFKTVTSYQFSRGIYRLPQIDFDPMKSFSLYFHPYSIFETRNYLVVRYFYKKLIIALINKDDRKSHLIYLDENENGGIPNDFDGGPLFQPQNYFVEDGKEYMVSIITSLEMKTKVKSTEFKNVTSKFIEKKEHLLKFSNTLKETDNPILMIVELKK
ncbi:MAG TPA: 6-bladed beta-propeller [Methanobacteriaceae archaeon]|nr:6-bladed beta-propeller [Methanobacteriaceae archaeon]